MDSEKERVVFVEFNSDGTPWEVITQETHPYGVRCNDYDFAMSKKYGLLSHESGGGGLPSTPIKVYQPQGSERVYWASPDVVVEEIGTCVQLEALPGDYTPEKLFDAICCDGQIVWCSTCDDWMPDSSSDLCEHVWYCECGEISTPDERCECKKEEE